MTEAVFEQPTEPTPEPAAEAASKTAPAWIEIFVGMIVEPLNTMRMLAQSNRAGFGGAALAVIIPTALDGVRMTDPENLVMAWLNVPGAIMMGLLLWTALAGLFSLTGWIFGASLERARRTFILTGWAMTPWIFMAPLYCFRELLGSWFALLAVIPLAWTFILQMLAVREAFELKSAQILLLFFAVPSLYILLVSLQFAQGIYVSLSSVL